MKKRLWIVCSLIPVGAIVAVLILSLLLPGGQENTATIVEAINTVDAHPHPKDDWQPAGVGMTLYGGGRVRTGAASSALLELLEGRVRLSADSVFAVKKSTTRQGKLVTTLFLQEGRLWGLLTTDQPHEFTVETGNAIAAVRDTRFSVWTFSDTTLVSVAEGKVTLTAQGQMVTVRAGEQAIVEDALPPSPPEPMSDEECALWATEGEMPALAPPTPAPTPTHTDTPTPTRTSTPVPPATGTPTPTLIPTETPTPTPTCTCTPTPWPTPTPTPTNTATRVPSPTLTPTREPTATPTQTPVQVSMGCDVSGYLWGPAGDPASRAPETQISVWVEGADAAQIVVELPNGETFALPAGAVYKGQWFDGPRELPQAGGTYTCIALDAGGVPIPGAVASDVYLGYEPAPPFNVQAQMVEAGILVTWNPPPTLPGAFDPGASPPLGWYHISVAVPGGMGSFTWTQGNWPMPETSHLIPFRRQDFGPGDEGLALGEMDDGLYDLAVHAASVAPEGTAGHGRECQARDTGEDVRVIIEGGQVRVE